LKNPGTNTQKQEENKMRNLFRSLFWVVSAGIFLVPAVAQTSQVSVTGFITDTLSGSTGATAEHSDASKRNVEAGMAKYAVYDEATKKLYILDPQETAASYLGQRVAVKGGLAASPITKAGQMVDPRTNEVKDFHRPVNSTTPVAGVLTISSIAAARASSQ
jgi:hypothetical protein